MRHVIVQAGDHREADLQLRAAVELLAPMRDITMPFQLSEERPHLGEILDVVGQTVV